MRYDGTRDFRKGSRVVPICKKADKKNSLLRESDKRIFMKKHLLYFLFAMCGMASNAQTSPSLTLHVEKTDGSERNLTFAATKAGHKLTIDWGDGVLRETEEIAVADDWGTVTTVTGIPSGEGKISVYGDGIAVFGCDSHIDGIKVTAVDVKNATELRELNVYTNALTTLDLSHNGQLEKLNCYNNQLTTLDISACKALKRLDAKDNPMTSVDLTSNTELTYLSLNNCPVGHIDLSGCTQLTSLYAFACNLTEIDLSHNEALTYITLNNNQLTELDVTACPKLGTLFCIDNQISVLKADNVTKTLNCSKNNLTLAALPALNIRGLTYAPQNAMAISASVSVGESVDLSAQDNLSGVTTETHPTTFTWKTEDGDLLTAGNDYTVKNGVFTFLKKQNKPVYCEMATDAFPKFSGANAFRTTSLLIEEGNGITGMTREEVIILASRGRIRLDNLPEKANVKVYDMNGKAVARRSSSTDRLDIGLQPGMYIVNVNGISRKINAQ